MSDVADRLRALAGAATAQLPGKPWEAEYIAARERRGAALGELPTAPELARGYADALDALARCQELLRHEEYGHAIAPVDSLAAQDHNARVLAAAARLFPEDAA